MQVHVAKGRGEALFSLRSPVTHASNVVPDAKGSFGLSQAVKDCALLDAGHKGWAQHTICMRDSPRCVPLCLEGAIVQLCYLTQTS
jgi:hypothetical protein